ncbi:MAG TPA: peptide-methionine (S)-S-oxide reductase MsrA [Fimbriimonadales bacterium]|nr:peptide-methionine (S)-S-oxide reductase MsrA [Fimbriimonadales bacterium]
MEAEFRRTSGVIATAVGYTGGNRENPTYQQVCSGDTGHAEAVLIEFDPNKVSFEKLLEIFFRIHDPSRPCGSGYQYRSAIFYRNEKQKRIAEELIEKMRKEGKKISTEIAPANVFWLAEEYHQQYYEKNGIRL